MFADDGSDGFIAPTFIKLAWNFLAIEPFGDGVKTHSFLALGQNLADNFYFTRVHQQLAIEDRVAVWDGPIKGSLRPFCGVWFGFRTCFEWNIIGDKHASDSGFGKACSCGNIS